MGWLGRRCDGLTCDSFGWPFEIDPLRNPTLMKHPLRTLATAGTLVMATVQLAVAQRPPSSGDTLIPPSTPLVACDPYFSIWSPGDTLNGVDSTHWTGKPHRLAGMIRVDGKPWRVIGSSPASVPALQQTGLSVLPTRTIYEFTGGGIALSLTFMTPALPDDLAVLSRPVTYLTWSFKAVDGREHDVQVYFDASSELVVNERSQQVTWAEESVGNLAALKMGSLDQRVLGRKGDDLRIDWGYLYTVAEPGAGLLKAVVPGDAARARFAADGQLPPADARQPRAVQDDTPVSALVLNAGRVGKEAVSRWLMLAYDDLYSIQYMKQNLRPYWRRGGWEAADLLKAAAAEFPELAKRCAAFDAELMADLERAGGVKYARICALAYRQCFAASKFVADANGQPLSFSKENHSNGCIGTSDVFYPMAPQFLLFGPSLAKSFLVPFMEYASSARWRFPFAPHDLGTYPHANGQVYGGGERTEDNQMPVEETGNLLILMAAVAEMDGNADFAGRYWPQLEKWAAYLKEKGFDPENQLCTDDFAGHMAHNVNLSVKAICGLGAYAKLCSMRGDKAQAAEYHRLARSFVDRWLKEADDGGHYRLAFDKPGTWSQKYNLVWDRILGLKLFPETVARKEMEHYRKVQNQYGLPLDNRQTYTKLDWILWSATLTQDRRDFDALVEPVFRFLNETPDRSPMTDWYQTKNAAKVGFTARPVVGGVFLQTLYDRGLWGKWAGRDATKAREWAPMPVPPQVQVVVPAADRQPSMWRYTTEEPAKGWETAGFDDRGWKLGPSGFGSPGTTGAVVRTVWDSNRIWLRREVELRADQLVGLKLWMHHDEDVEVFINGVEAFRASGYVTDYEAFPMTPAGAAALKEGRNVIAMRCRQNNGGQFVDVGFVREAPAARP